MFTDHRLAAIAKVEVEASPAEFQRRFCARLRIDGFPICDEIHCRGPGPSRHREPGIHSSLLHCGIVTKPGHSAGRPGGVLVVCRATRAQAYLNEYSEKLSAESRKNRMIKQCSLVRQTWHSEQAGQMFALSTFCKKGIALSFAHVVPVSIRCTVSVWPWQWSTKRTGSRWSVVRLVSDHCSVDSVECLGCWTVCTVSTPGQ